MKNCRNRKKKSIRLVGGDQNLPIDFLFEEEIPFAVVLYYNKILFYDRDEVLSGKTFSYINLTFTNAKELASVFFIVVKKSQYLMIATKVIFMIKIIILIFKYFSLKNISFINFMI